MELEKYMREIVIHTRRELNTSITRHRKGNRPVVLKLVWRCNQILSGFQVNAHLLRMSCQSRLSTNKGDNEMLLGVLHRFTGIRLSAE